MIMTAHYVSVRKLVHSVLLSDEHWKCFESIAGETSEKWGGAHLGFSEHQDTILN